MRRKKGEEQKYKLKLCPKHFGNGPNLDLCWLCLILISALRSAHFQHSIHFSAVSNFQNYVFPIVPWSRESFNTFVPFKQEHYVAVYVVVLDSLRLSCHRCIFFLMLLLELSSTHEKDRINRVLASLHVLPVRYTIDFFPNPLLTSLISKPLQISLRSRLWI